MFYQTIYLQGKMVRLHQSRNLLLHTSIESNRLVVYVSHPNTAFENISDINDYLGSPICFVLAAFHYPAAITSTFGRMAEELSDETWKLLDTPIDSKSNSSSSNEMGLGMLLKMSRCDDLGLGQLLFPDSESDPDTHDSSYDREHERRYEPDRARDYAYDIDRDDTPDSDSDYGSEVSVCGSDCSCRLSKVNYHKYHGEVEEEEERGRKRTRG